MKILYLDCFSGISGDMFLAALIDAGADVSYIKQELGKLNLSGFELQTKNVVKNGITSVKADVVVTEAAAHTHHRHYTDIVQLIEQANLAPDVTATALDIFLRIGKAEGKIHGIPLEKVHFHEVGAVDSIVDTVGAALALHSLQVDRVLSSPIPMGSGFVRCDHGLYPVPAPAALEIMKGLPLAHSVHKAELTTPTGAGIAASLVHDWMEAMPHMKVTAIGYGAGTRDLPQQPNALRSVIGDTTAANLELAIQREQNRHQQNHAHHHAHDHEHHHHSHNHSDDHAHHHHDHTHDGEHSHHHHHDHGHDHNEHP
ncbi:LarC family nickel insertion protein [Marinicrinis sediminis]|uniref:LarC family nickel insertion protein n=1 Tax=Marinicrinis sediminis TaxID=1652465 RepID=A0ABW5R841_9BACL